MFRAYDLPSQYSEANSLEDYGDIPEAQLALCQAMYDECRDRRIHIEKKSMWTLAAISFIATMFTSFATYVIESRGIDIKNFSFSMVLLLLCAFLLFSSFISVIRAVSIKSIFGLYKESVFHKDTEKFMRYDRKFHGKGLVFCASYNTVVNDHIAQFVRYAHQLLLWAAVCFVLGLGGVIIPEIEFGIFRWIDTVCLEKLSNIPFSEAHPIN